MKNIRASFRSFNLGLVLNGIRDINHIRFSMKVSSIA